MQIVISVGLVFAKNPICVIEQIERLCVQIGSGHVNAGDWRRHFLAVTHNSNLTTIKTSSLGNKGRIRSAHGSLILISLSGLTQSTNHPTRFKQMFFKNVKWQ